MVLKQIRIERKTMSCIQEKCSAMFRFAMFRFAWLFNVAKRALLHYARMDLRAFLQREQNIHNK